MQIILSKYCDFCNGVKRTIEISDDVLGKEDNVYSIGEVIHNAQETKRLEKKGLKIVKDISQIPSGSYLLIRSHGISPSSEKEAKRRKIRLIDAACPFVKYIQQICQDLKSKGYFIIITGDADHPEVEALQDIAGEMSIVVSDTESDISLPDSVRKVGFISQSTYTKVGLYKVISKILDYNLAEVRIFNTICEDSLTRRTEAEKIASMVDAVVVIGGKNSANTLRLLQTSKEINSHTYHIKEYDEADNFFKSVGDIANIGVIAGASTPRWIINEFLKKAPKSCSVVPVGI